jgi:hypothetical protein
MVFFLAGSLFGQSSWQKTDSLTYQLYMAKDWKGLLAEADRSLREGIDFYYLRVRAGIAAYERRNYRLAALHLSKAHEWNHSDEFVNYWYYYALLMGSRQDEARVLASGFSPEYMERMQISPVKGVHSVMAETMISCNADYQKLLDDNIAGDYSYLGYRNVLKRQVYNGVGLDHRVTDRLFAFHGISHLRIDRMQHFRYVPSGLDGQVESRSNQFQYYLQGRYTDLNGWSVSASVTLLTGETVYNYMTINMNDVSFLNRYEYEISDQVVMAGIAREYKLFRPSVSFILGNVNNYRQLQARGQLVLYPAGNPDVYLVSGFNAHNDAGEGSIRYVTDQKLGFRTGPFWLSGHAAFGRIRNFTMAEGYVVYNMPETINGLYGVTALLPLFSNRLELSVRYQYMKKEGMTFEYSTPVDFKLYPYRFNENSLLISLNWHL